MIAAPDPHIRSRSRVLLKAALVVLPFGLTAACERKADDNYAPVKTRTIPMSRTDLTPIETRLYNYVGDTWTEKEKFITDGKPPLRFSFPAAYYGHKSNFDGGAQPRINIRLDPNTLLPSSVRFEQDGPDRPIRVIPNRGRLNSVGITIFSNVVFNLCPVEAGDTAFPLEEAAPSQPLRIRRRKVVEIDRQGPYRFFAYGRPDPPQHSTDPDVLRGHFGVMGFPDPYAATLVKFIHCDGLDNGCTANFFFHGRTVAMYVGGQVDIRQLEIIAHRVSVFLERHIVS